jgi:ABC-type multidrug transport system fused ATPase/permease subunit
MPSPFASAIIVAKTAPSPLDQILAPRDLFRRPCLVVWLWSILSAVLLLLLLVVGGLLLGLLADRGRLVTNLAPDEVERFRELTGLRVGSTPQEQAAAPGDRVRVPGDEAQDKPAGAVESAEPPNPVNPAKAAESAYVSHDEYGILPAVWRSRNAWWGDALGWLFRRFELLQSNVLALMTLLFAGAFLFTARAACLSQLRRRARHSALNAVVATRRNVHRQALRLGSEDLDGSGLETATRLFTVEIENVRRSLVNWIECDIRYPLELAGLAMVALSLQPLVSVQFLLFLGATWYYLEARHRGAEAELRLTTDHANAELRNQADGFQSARLVRGLGIEQMDHDHFANHLARFHDLSKKQDRAAERAGHLRIRDVAACSAIAALLVFILSTHILLKGGELSIASGGVFVAAWMLAIPGTKAIRSRSALLHDANASTQAIHNYLDRIPTVSQAVGARFLQPLGKTLHYDSVTYRTPAGRVLLSEIDLKLEAGRTYSLVSLDPLEANAMASLLPRFIEPQQGRILFDGEDICWSTLESLRAETVFVGANDPLLPGTVLDNIRGGRADFTPQQATEAAKLTHAHNFIVKLFDGYESELAERPDLMEVSQRFRLGLARAMVRNPALLIIEEPRVVLDDDTKALLADAYERICRDRTVIFLPGRLSTVRRSDEVIVLNEGRVAAIGPQSKLVSASAIYRHWEYLNFNEFRHQDG